LCEAEWSASRPWAQFLPCRHRREAHKPRHLPFHTLPCKLLLTHLVCSHAQLHVLRVRGDVVGQAHALPDVQPRGERVPESRVPIIVRVHDERLPDVCAFFVSSGLDCILFERSTVSTMRESEMLTYLSITLHTLTQKARGRGLARPASSAGDTARMHAPCHLHRRFSRYGPGKLAVHADAPKRKKGNTQTKRGERKKERKQTTQGRDGRTARRHHTGILRRGVWCASRRPP